MLITHEREKLINAIIFFAENTNYLGKIKLCKLLYFLDFEHFKETGRSVTGLNYFALPNGPVPVEFFHEVDDPKSDMAEKIDFSYKKIKQGNMLIVDPIGEFNQSHFSKREMRLMKKLAEEYSDSKTEEMIEATHLENQPWHKIYEELGQRQAEIPYSLATLKQEENVMMATSKERQAIVNHFNEV